MERIDVTIIIPIYQVEKYIERCIDSVLNQTYSHSKIECILVDDCGTDHSINLVNNRIKNYSGEMRFTIIHNERNCGLSVSRNNAMKEATGDFLFFLDSDDHITPDCIEKLMIAHKKYPEAEVIKANHIDRRNNESVSIRQIPLRIIENEELMKLFFLSNIPCMAWNTLILRELVVNNHLLFFPNLIFEDIHWSFHLFRKTKAFLFIPDITLFYEANPNSIINRKSDELKKIDSQLIILEDLLGNIENRYYEGIILYITTMFLVLIDKMDYNTNAAKIRPLFKIRNKVFIKTCCDLRIILSLFLLLTFQPIKMIIKIRFFRTHYYRILNSVWIIAHFFSPLHKFRLNQR